MPFRNLHQMKLYNKQCPTAITHGHAHILAVPMKPCIAATLPDICARIQSKNRITSTNVTMPPEINRALLGIYAHTQKKNHITVINVTLQPIGKARSEERREERV